MKMYPNFQTAINHLMERMKNSSQLVHTETWQGVDISQKPEMATYELLNQSIQVPIPSEDLHVLQADIRPNSPWTDDHFEERVCGYPLNPGVEWANWPYGKSAAQFLDESGMFNHSYAERYWPRFAGTLGALKTKEEGFEIMEQTFHGAHRGIRNQYGDLNDIVGQLLKEPQTRQAYMPIFFPEDTGGANGGRVPCSLGYHFIMRGNFLHITYYLRSCDIVRHFRDDIYLTVRLLLWVLDRLREVDDEWEKVNPGLYTMHMTSLHMFKADFQPTFGITR